MLAVASDIPTLASLGGQPASTAITTGNIGSQSVNYANSAGNSNAVFGYNDINALKSAMGIIASPIMLGTGTISVSGSGASGKYTCRISGVYNSVEVVGNIANPNQSPYTTTSTAALISGGCSYIIITTDVGVYTIMAGGSGLIYSATKSANISLSSNGVSVSSTTTSESTSIANGSFVAYRQP